MGVTTLLLISVFFLDRSHNTHRWIHAGGFSLQPSELAKVALIIYMAYSLDKRQEKLKQFMSGFFPYLLILGAREAENRTVAVRTRNGEDLGAMPLEQFLSRLRNEIACRGRNILED